MTLTNDSLDLLARAAHVIDSLDDIDEIATIGGPMDELGTFVDDLARLDAVTALVRGGMEIDRVVRAFDACAEVSWRTAWLTRHAGLDMETARVVSTLDAGDLVRFVDDTGDEMARSNLVAAADAAARDLAAVLALYPQTRTYDTLPPDWSVESLDG